MLINGISDKYLNKANNEDSVILNLAINMNGHIHHILHVLSGVYDNAIISRITDSYFEHLAQKGKLKGWGKKYNIVEGSSCCNSINRHYFENDSRDIEIKDNYAILNKATNCLDMFVERENFEGILEDNGNFCPEFYVELGVKPLYIEHLIWLDYDTLIEEPDSAGRDHVIEASKHISAIYTAYAKEIHILTADNRYTPLKGRNHIFEVAVDDKVIFSTATESNIRMGLLQPAKTLLYVSLFEDYFDDIYLALHPLFDNPKNKFDLQITTAVAIQPRNPKSESNERIVKRFSFNFIEKGEIDDETAKAIMRLKTSLSGKLKVNLDKLHERILETCEMTFKYIEVKDSTTNKVRNIFKDYLPSPEDMFDMELPF